jgi:hypothetical protein
MTEVNVLDLHAIFVEQRCESLHIVPDINEDGVGFLRHKLVIFPTYQINSISHVKECPRYLQAHPFHMVAGRDRLIRAREQYMSRDVIAPNCVEIREKDIAPGRLLGFESIALIFSIGLV